MLRMLTGVATLLLAMFLAAPNLARAQTADPASLVAGLTAALNSYEETDIAMFLTEDAVLSYTAQATNIGGASYEGRDSILSLVPQLRREAVRYEVMGTPQSSGNMVTWVWRETSDTLAANSYDFLEYNAEGTVVGDRLQSITLTFTDDSVAKLQRAVSGPGPIGMPRTGEGSAPGYGWLLALGALLALNGIGMHRHSRRTP
ncbi:MAG TPA: hypothetical protein VGE45_04570 [Chloroflexia bacterium]|jgi:hypothetical protein